MGLLTFGGMIISFAAIIYGIIILSDVAMVLKFIDAPSAFMVVVPMIGSLLSTFPISVFARIPAHMKAMISKPYFPEAYIPKIVELATKVRSQGILSLEDEKIEEPTMNNIVRMMVDGMQEEEILRSVEENMVSLNERHMEAISFYEKAASYAPAYGMCGTVIGLVVMLMNLDFSDPNAINSLGGGMAAALITTFYGSVFANVIFAPMANRLKVIHKREMFCKNLICSGLLAIHRGNNPRSIYDFLSTQLNAKDLKKLQKNSDIKIGGGTDE